MSLSTQDQVDFEKFIKDVSDMGYEEALEEHTKIDKILKDVALFMKNTQSSGGRRWKNIDNLSPEGLQEFFENQPNLKKIFDAGGSYPYNYYIGNRIQASTIDEVSEVIDKNRGFVASLLGSPFLSVQNPRQKSEGKFEDKKRLSEVLDEIDFKSLLFDVEKELRNKLELFMGPEWYQADNASMHMDIFPSQADAHQNEIYFNTELKIEVPEALDPDHSVKVYLESAIKEFNPRGEILVDKNRLEDSVEYKFSWHGPYIYID